MRLAKKLFCRGQGAYAAPSRAPLGLLLRQGGGGTTSNKEACS
jgi:hypothetical protein